jgi:hypothetical protein
MVERVHSCIPLLFSDPTKPTELAISSHCHEIKNADWKIPIDTFTLGNIGDEMALILVGFSVNPDFAGGFRNKVEAGFEKRALPGSVGTNHGDELVLWDVKIDVPENGLSVIGDGEVVDREWHIVRVKGNILTGGITWRGHGLQDLAHDDW